MVNSPSVFFGTLDQKSKEAVLKMVASEAAEKYKAYKEAVIFATGLREVGGQAALKKYESMTPEQWAFLQQVMPQEYDRQQRDWGRQLSKRIRNPKQSIMQSNEAKVSRDIGVQPEAL